MLFFNKISHFFWSFYSQNYWIVTDWIYYIYYDINVKNNDYISLNTLIIFLIYNPLTILIVQNLKKNLEKGKLIDKELDNNNSYSYIKPLNIFIKYKSDNLFINI